MWPEVNNQTSRGHHSQFKLNKGIDGRRQNSEVTYWAVRGLPGFKSSPLIKPQEEMGSRQRFTPHHLTLHCRVTHPSEKADRHACSGRVEGASCNTGHEGEARRDARTAKRDLQVPHHLTIQQFSRGFQVIFLLMETPLRARQRCSGSNVKNQGINILKNKTYRKRRSLQSLTFFFG